MHKRPQDLASRQPLDAGAFWMREMKLANLSMKPLASHVPLCRITLAGLVLLVAAMGFAFSPLKCPCLHALLLTAGLLGMIFGIGRKHHVVYSENGENA